MEPTRTQAEINHAEWHDPANWSGKWPCNAYFSKLDSRLLVPAIWNTSWSPHILNHGHSLAALLQYGFLLMMCIVVGIIASARAQEDRERGMDAPPPAARQVRPQPR